MIHHIQKVTCLFLGYAEDELRNEIAGEMPWGDIRVYAVVEIMQEANESKAYATIGKRQCSFVI